MTRSRAKVNWKHLESVVVTVRSRSDSSDAASRYFFEDSAHVNNFLQPICTRKVAALFSVVSYLQYLRSISHALVG